MYINSRWKDSRDLALQTEKLKFSANAFLRGKIFSQPVWDRISEQFMRSAEQKSSMRGGPAELDPATSSVVVQPAWFHASADH